MSVFDPTPCTLGEGALWHPKRGELFWFDILAKRLYAKAPHGALTQWQFSEHHSAAAWVDRDTLLIASETALWRFDIPTGARTRLVALEADNPVTRSNDGRADPWGGFWIGTMGKQAEPKAGRIWRFFKGALTPLFADMTITNAICFAPDRSVAYLCDTAEGRILRQPLDEEGWPSGPRAVFIDHAGAAFGPDGAVTDAEGCLWVAHWGAARLRRYSPTGAELADIALPAAQISCPAFGGADYATLFATSARTGLEHPTPSDGQTFSARPGARGTPEPPVDLT